MKTVSIAIIIAALCSPAAADDWQDRAQAAVTSSATDTQRESFPIWMLIVVIPRQLHIAVHGYPTDDACVKAGQTMIAKTEALPWFCVIEPREVME